MHADIEGAVRIARLAADFDWTWTVGSLEQFCRAAGWKQPVPDEFGYGAEILTNLSVSSPAAYASFDPRFYRRTGLPEGEVAYLVVALTDSIAGDATEENETLIDSFAEITTRLASEFGEPSRLHGTQPGIVWELPELVTLELRLDFNRQGIALRIVNAWYHDRESRSSRQSDDQDEDEHELFPVDDTWPSSLEWSECSAELALGLAHLPPGGVVQLTVDEEFAALFAMDLLKLWCVISVGAESPEEMRRRLTDHGWSVPNAEAKSLWRRSIRWPAAYAEFLAFSEDFLSNLVAAHPTASPSDVGWYASVNPGLVGSVGWGILRHSTGI